MRRLLPLAALAAGLLVAPSAGSAATHTVAMGDDFFWSSAQGSSTITIQVGDTVVWENRGDDPHNAAAEDGSWRSTELRRGQSYARTFTAPGEYAYLCTLHIAEEMFGRVVVVGGASAPTPSPTSSAGPALTRQAYIPTAPRP